MGPKAEETYAKLFEMYFNEWTYVFWKDWTYSPLMKSISLPQRCKKAPRDRDERAAVQKLTARMTRAMIMRMKRKRRRRMNISHQREAKMRWRQKYWITCNKWWYRTNYLIFLLLEIKKTKTLLLVLYHINCGPHSDFFSFFVILGMD